LSIGTLSNWKDPSVVVSEEPITDPLISIGNGYAESKYVTERVRSPLMNIVLPLTSLGIDSS
jgi:hypothetical protein